MYVAKYFTKIYVCLGSKIPHEKRERASKKRIRKKIERKIKKIIVVKYCLAEKPT